MSISQSRLSERGCTFIGMEFVRQYYSILVKHPEHISRFYKDQSFFTNETLVTGRLHISEELAKLDFRDGCVTIMKMTCQPTILNGLIVNIHGTLQKKNSCVRHFLQTFLLLSYAENKFYVQNDLFAYQNPETSYENNYDDIPRNVQSENDYLVGDFIPEPPMVVSAANNRVYMNVLPGSQPVHTGCYLNCPACAQHNMGFLTEVPPVTQIYDTGHTQIYQPCFMPETAIPVNVPAANNEGSKNVNVAPASKNSTTDTTKQSPEETPKIIGSTTEQNSQNTVVPANNSSKDPPKAAKNNNSHIKEVKDKNSDGNKGTSNAQDKSKLYFQDNKHWVNYNSGNRMNNRQMNNQNFQQNFQHNYPQNYQQNFRPRNNNYENRRGTGRNQWNNNYQGNRREQSENIRFPAGNNRVNRERRQPLLPYLEHSLDNPPQPQRQPRNNAKNKNEQANTTTS